MSTELRQALEEVARRFRHVRLWGGLALCWLAWAVLGLSLSALRSRSGTEPTPAGWPLRPFPPRPPPPRPPARLRTDRPPGRTGPTRARTRLHAPGRRPLWGRRSGRGEPRRRGRAKSRRAQGHDPEPGRPHVRRARRVGLGRPVLPRGVPGPE